MTIEDVASTIAGTLSQHRAGFIYGVPGGGNNLEVIGAAESRGVRFVLTHTETAGTIMAGVHAELTGRISASVMTRGPGAASGVNGAAQALLDRQPLLMLTDTVSDADSARISHQLLDQRAMFGAVTKWSTVVGRKDPEQVLESAVEVATSGRPGPVHLDIDPTADHDSDPPPRPQAAGDLHRALALIKRARRPVILLGLGARGFGQEVLRIVADSGTPVMMTYKAKGVLPDSDPHVAGLFTGAHADGAVLREADLIVCLGLDTVELIPNPWPFEAGVLSLASWPESHPYLEYDVEVVGDLASLLVEVAPIAADWDADFVTRHRERATSTLLGGAQPDFGVAPWDIVHCARQAAPSGSVATVDAGAHMLAAMPLWSTENPGEILISSGLATMGFSLPAAIAAALVHPDRRTYCFVGDGGLGMVLAELETVARLRLPITVIVFNDSTLTLIELKQKSEGNGGPKAVKYRATDFAMIAQAVGIPAQHVEDLPQLAATLQDTSPLRGPEVLDVLVDSRSYRHVIDVVRHGSEGMPAGMVVGGRR